MRRPVNSGHFNAKDSGTERRKKLGTINTNASNENDLANLFPYA